MGLLRYCGAMNTHQTPNHLSITFHRARPRNGQAQSMAIVRSSKPGLVRWRRVLLPVSQLQIEHCQRVVHGLLRQLGAGG